MSSKDFQDFVSSCFPHSWGADHDGLNYDALLRLMGDELLIAEKRILDGIPQTWGTNRTIEAAGCLRLQSASKLLKKELRITKLKRVLNAVFFLLLYPFWYEYYHERIVTISWSLYQIEKYPKSLPIIIAELESVKNQKLIYLPFLAFHFLISFGDDAKAIEYLNKCTKNKNFAFDAIYALEAIQDGNRLPFQGNYSEISRRANKKLEFQRNKTWEWL